MLQKGTSRSQLSSSELKHTAGTSADMPQCQLQAGVKMQAEVKTHQPRITALSSSGDEGTPKPNMSQTPSNVLSQMTSVKAFESRIHHSYCHVLSFAWTVTKFYHMSILAIVRVLFAFYQKRGGFHNSQVCLQKNYPCLIAIHSEGARF